MGVTQYIGSRYVPVFADPAEWNNTRTYEPLTIVLHDGNSYTSKQYVPTGIDIADGDYWAETGNYNSQVEQYRKEVLAFDDRITNNADAIVSEKNRAEAAEKVNADAISLLNDYNAYDMVVIGDSYSHQNYLDGTLWCDTVAKRMNMNLHNFADPGAGYIHNGDIHKQNFSGEIDRATADESFDNAHVGIVIILGGVNDFGFSDAASKITNGHTYMDDYVSPTLTKAAQSFPNAKIYVGVDMFANFATVNNQCFSNFMFERTLLQCANRFSAPGSDMNYDFNANIIPMSLLYIWWQNGNCFTGGVQGHPNQHAHNLLARVVMGYLSGKGWQNVRGTHYLDTDVNLITDSIGTMNTIVDRTSNSKFGLAHTFSDFITFEASDNNRCFVDFEENKWHFTMNALFAAQRQITETIYFELVLPTGVSGAALRNPGGQITDKHAVISYISDAGVYGGTCPLYNTDIFPINDSTYGNCICGFKLKIDKPLMADMTKLRLFVSCDI